MELSNSWGFGINLHFSNCVYISPVLFYIISKCIQQGSDQGCSDKVTRLTISPSDVRLIRGQIGQIDLYFNPPTGQLSIGKTKMKSVLITGSVLFCLLDLPILTNDSVVEREASARPWLFSIALEVQLTFIIHVQLIKPIRLHCSGHCSALGI